MIYFYENNKLYFLNKTKKYIFVDIKEENDRITRTTKLSIKNTVKNRGAFLIEEQLTIPPVVNPQTRAFNGVRNWRTNKLTFEVVDKINNIIIPKTPETLKPCWLQKRSIKKNVRFNLPDEVHSNTTKSILKESPPPEPTASINIHFNSYNDTGATLLKIIYSWNPDWLKSVHPDLEQNNPSSDINVFDSHEQYKRYFTIF